MNGVRAGRESGVEQVHPPDSRPAGFRRGGNRDTRLGEAGRGETGFGKTGRGKTGQSRARTSHQRNGPDGPTPWKVIRVIVTFFTAVVAGWFAAQGIVFLIGRPPALVQYLLAIVLSILISGVVAIILTKITGRAPGDPQLGEELMAALERISRGDFSVRLKPYSDGPLKELAESVNSMAAGLGTMEQKRQEFISNVSHEIQSPLTSISGFASLLREDGVDPATRRHYVDVIVSESKRLSTLSDNLLRLSALDDEVALHKTEYRLDEQLRSVVVMLEPQWSGKNIVMEVTAHPVEIEADKEMLSLVWINIINNAVKYTQTGGRISVALHHDGNNAICTVTDTGMGIAEEDLPHIFERFFRADKARSGEGNGLGLALAKRIVEIHCGDIDVTSEVGAGTSISVHLPIEG